jgi:CRISPR/Cas system-associated exonuclease Cas4 (RecB family)
MELPRLSASKLKTFSSCPKKFYYEYVDRQESTKHIAAIMGTAVHKSIDSVYSARRNGHASQDVDILYHIAWTEEFIRSPGAVYDRKVFEDGLGIVKRYDFEKRTPNATEFEFRLPFPDPIMPMCEIHGYIDQMYDWGLVDMKTSKRKPAQVLLDNDLQFIVYAWAFYNIVGENPNHVLWHHLRTGEDLEFNLSIDKVDLASRVVERILESQESSVWDRNVGEACLFCSHRRVCLGAD